VAGERADLMRALIEAFNARDIEAFLDLVHPDAEWLPIKGKLEGTVYRGHEGVRRFLAELAEDFEDVRLESPAVSERGDMVVVCGGYRARGVASGVELAFPLTQVAQFRDGKIVRLEAYSDPSEALEAGDAQPRG